MNLVKTLNMNNIDIRKVGAVHQDFTNKIIKILSKEGFEMWSRGYKLEDTFDSAFRQIMKKFDAELKRRNEIKK